MTVLSSELNLKFNPNHDRLGRFATGTTRESRFSSVAAKLQQQHDRRHDSAAGRVELIDNTSTRWQVGSVSDSAKEPSWYSAMSDSEKLAYKHNQAKQQWRAMLTDDEVNGVRAYRSGSASVGTHGEGIGWYGDRAFKEDFNHKQIREHIAGRRHKGTEAGKAAEAFSTAVDVAPSYSGTVLRGMRFKDEKSADSFAKYLEEKGGLRMATHSSATSNRFDAARFTGASPNDPSKVPSSSVMLRVKAKTAADISAVGDTEEFILRKGTKYRHVRTTKSAGGGYYIDVEEV